MKKLKIAWICHFRNAHINEVIKPYKYRGEFAPWIPNFIRILKEHDDIELHIISPHTWIPKYTTFIEDDVTYHFFNCGIPFTGVPWFDFFPLDYWTDFYLNKWNVKRIIDRIQPDLIHLIGAENAYYSSSIIQFRNKYPVFITLQGFVNHASGISKKTEYSKKIERKILNSFNHYGIRNEKMYLDIKEFNASAKSYWNRFPVFFNNENYKNFYDKEFDVVFFARICNDKGIEDLVNATALIKKRKSDIKLLIIGTGSGDYINYIKSLAIKLSVDDNITWAGFLATQDQLHFSVSNARVSVLPTYFDNLPLTITESMFLKIPVVAYATDSIPELNKKVESILLVDKFDIDGLAEKILLLLENEELWNKMAEQGYKTINEWFDNSKVYPELRSAYEAVIEDFNSKKV
jgi:glycosyltransferase involved in cell wall biosynthesis